MELVPAEVVTFGICHKSLNYGFYLLSKLRCISIFHLQFDDLSPLSGEKWRMQKSYYQLNYIHPQNSMVNYTSQVFK